MKDAPATASNLYNNILFFDGQCVLCSSWVRFLIRFDKQGVICFATLQSGILEKSIPIVEVSALPDSVVFLQNNELFTRSDAISKILGLLPFPWALAGGFIRIFPKAFSDRIYNLVAKNRFKWFGQYDQCMLPGEYIRNRFLSE